MEVMLLHYGQEAIMHSVCTLSNPLHYELQQQSALNTHLRSEVSADICAVTALPYTRLLYVGVIEHEHEVEDLGARSYVYIEYYDTDFTARRVGAVLSRCRMQHFKVNGASSSV